MTIDKTLLLADRLPGWVLLSGLVLGGIAVGLGAVAIDAGHTKAWIGVASGAIGVIGCFSVASKRLAKASA